MRPPSQRLTPRDRDRQAAPPRPSGGGARGPGGDSGEPSSPSPPPPPSPWVAGGRPERRQPRTPLSGPLHPGEGRHSRGECSHAPSAPGRPPAHSRIARCRPAALRRRRGTQQHGGAQECADEAARLDARPGKAGEQAVARKPPPPRTNPLAADWTAPGAHDRPATRVYLGGARRGRRGTGPGAMGLPRGQRRGEQRHGPPSPLPPTLPGLQATGAPALYHPRGQGGVPPPPEGTVTPGGGAQLDPHAARPRALHCLPPRGSRQAGKAAQARKNGAQAPPGAAHDNGPEQYGGRAPMTRASPMTPAMLPAVGGQRDGPRQHHPPAPRPPGHPPGGAAHGPPPPPPSQAGSPAAGRSPRPGLPHAPDQMHTLGRVAPATKGGEAEGRRPPPPEREEGSHGATPHYPPTPPTNPQATGAPAPTPPEAEKVIPPPPGTTAAPGRKAGAGPPPTPQPPAPAGTTMDQRTRANTPGRHTGRAQRQQASTNRSGIGATPSMARATSRTPALLPAQGRQRDGPRQGDPQPHWPPRPHRPG